VPCMRIFLIVMAVLLLLITAVMCSGVVIEVSFRSCRLEWCVRYLGIRILPGKKKPEKPAASDVQETPEEPGEPAAEKPPKKRRRKEKETPDKPERKPFFMDALWEKLQDLAEKMDMAGSGLHALPGPLRRILRGVTLYDIDTDIVTAHEDADRCAQLYGAVTGGIGDLLGHASLFMKVRPGKIRVVCDYAADACRFDFSFRVRLRIGAAVGAALWFLWT